LPQASQVSRPRRRNGSFAAGIGCFRRRATPAARDELRHLGGELRIDDRRVRGGRAVGAARDVDGTLQDAQDRPRRPRASFSALVRQTPLVRVEGDLPFVVEVLAGHEPTAPCHRADELDALGALDLAGRDRRVPVTHDRLPRVDGAADRERMRVVVSGHAVEDIAAETASSSWISLCEWKPASAIGCANRRAFGADAPRR